MNIRNIGIYALYIYIYIYIYIYKLWLYVHNLFNNLVHEIATLQN